MDGQSFHLQCFLGSHVAEELKERSKDGNCTENDLTRDVTLVWTDEDDDDITVLFNSKTLSQSFFYMLPLVVSMQRIETKVKEYSLLFFSVDTVHQPVILIEH